MILLAFRLFSNCWEQIKRIALSRASYTGNQIIVGIFEGIFSQVLTDGVETTGVFEPATLIAMVAVIAWVVLKLIMPRNGSRFERTEYIELDNQKN